MKKLLLMLLISATAGMNAQTLFEENFNTLPTPIVLPTAWSQLNLSEPVGPGTWFTGSVTNFTAFNGPDNGYIGVNYQSGSGVSTLNNWLMTPAVTVQNGDVVSFYSRVPTGSSFADRLELRQSIAGAASVEPSGLTNMGSYSTLCLTINPTLVAANYPQTWTKFTYVVTGLTGQVSSRFALRYTVSNGGTGANSNYVGVDAFKVSRPVQNDISLNTVTVPPVISAGNFSFVGQVGNSGTNAITSYKVSWQSNGGTVNSYDVTGVNIAPGLTNVFTHSLPLNAVVGQSYALTFNVSMVNGVADTETGNNTITRNTQVASGSTTFKTLIEKFTSSTCGPCAGYNNSTFNPFYAAQNQNFNYVAYQQNFPSTGDPYYTAEAGVRRGYYGINSITSVRIDGADYYTGNNQTAITNFINANNSKTGYFGLTGTRDFTGNNAAVTYTITPYLSGTYNLQIAVYEKLTTGNIATNGETSFKHVMMKMVPNASGTTIAFTAGTPVSGSLTASLAGTNIEDITDCEVMMFIQNPVTKEIMQSFRAADLLSTTTNTLAETIRLYPNPSSDIVRISSLEKVDVVVADLLGKTVISLKDITNQNDINVSGLENGVYLFSIKNATGSQTLKFVKK